MLRLEAHDPVVVGSNDPKNRWHLIVKELSHIATSMLTGTYVRVG